MSALGADGEAAVGLHASSSEPRRGAKPGSATHRRIGQRAGGKVFEQLLGRRKFPLGHVGQTPSFLF
jgi:hypothetical protein